MFTLCLLKEHVKETGISSFDLYPNFPPKYLWEVNGDISIFDLSLKTNWNIKIKEWISLLRNAKCSIFKTTNEQRNENGQNKCFHLTICHIQKLSSSLWWKDHYRRWTPHMEGTIISPRMVLLFSSTILPWNFHGPYKCVSRGENEDMVP